jgi:hypothetical protein
MSWATDLPITRLTSDLLNLRLKVEKLRLEANVTAMVYTARAMGAPSPDAATLMRVPKHTAVTYELPPLKYLEVKSGGSF